MKVLLINPWLDLKLSVHKAYIPLGITYIASVLRQAGHEICLLDTNIIGIGNLEKKLRTVDFDIAGITVLTDSFYFTEQVTSLIREISSVVPIILGGPMVTAAAEIIMNNTLADIAILGEGEETIVELINVLSKKGDLAKVRGICYKDKDNLHFTSPRPRIKNLDEIPFPAFDLFDLGFYFQSRPRFSSLAQLYPYLSLMTHRGCSYHCKFCQIPQIWPKISFRSTDNTIKELIWQKKEFGVKGVYIRDDNFGPSEKRIRLFCQNLIEAGIEMDFVCLMRATAVNHLDTSTLQLMRNAGCRGVRIGIESGEEETLRKTAKGITLEDIERAIKRLQDSGFSTDGSFLMIGHPDETEKSIDDTIEFISRLGISVLPLFAISLPGTPWYLQAEGKGLIPNEVEFLRELRFWQERPVVNMSHVSDEKLIEALKILKTWGD